MKFSDNAKRNKKMNREFNFLMLVGGVSLLYLILKSKKDYDKEKNNEVEEFKKELNNVNSFNFNGTRIVSMGVRG